SGIAIYLFVCKRNQISSILTLLLNYSTQLTLTELKEKLDALNNLKTADAEQHEEIINVMNDILGQINGNKSLQPHFSEIVEKISKALKKKLTEPVKRLLVSELRETIKHANIASMDQIVGKK
ncbi:MAG TPA: hypothetical protein VN114_07185, partial [Oxalicibacterium sp.]|uniref:hypothetical protein n=1 Tax=Oxalicibacterium sp. TaxID=2766525 RepID=UPI002C9317B2